MKKVILAVACAFALSGQNTGGFRYSSTSGNVSLSGSGYSFTVQQPSTASSAKQVQLEAAVVYCSVACTVTQAQNGTAATATAGTVNPLLPFGPASLTTVWTSSNVGTGTPAGGSLALQAGIPVTLDMSGISLPKANSGTNYTWTFSSITGSVNVTVYWREQP